MYVISLPAFPPHHRYAFCPVNVLTMSEVACQYRENPKTEIEVWIRQGQKMRFSTWPNEDFLFLTSSDYFQFFFFFALNTLLLNFSLKENLF